MGPPSTLHDRVVFVSNVSRDSDGTLQSADISPELELTTVTAVYAMARTERFTEARGDDNPSRVSTDEVAYTVDLISSVATDSEGRPRGFGTALFASEKDAASAVGTYNG